MSDLRLSPYAYSPSTAATVYGGNRIINSNFAVKQARVASTVSGSTAIGVRAEVPIADCWKLVIDGPNFVTPYSVTYNVNGPSSVVPYRSLRVDFSGGIGVGSVGFVGFQTPIPVKDIEDLAIGYPTAEPYYITFPLKSSGSGAVGVTLMYAGTSASPIMVRGIVQAVAGQWVDAVVGPIKGPLTGGVLTGYDNKNHVILTICALSGVNARSDVVGQEVSGFKFGPTTNRMTFGEVGCYFELGGEVQLVRGAQVQAYVPKSFAVEYQACLRYYSTSYTDGVLPGNISLDNAAYQIGSNISVQTVVTYPQRLHSTTPTVLVYNPDTGAVNAVHDGVTAVSRAVNYNVALAADRCKLFSVTGIGTAPSGEPLPSSLRFHWTAEVPF
jgi:hypothetical protein